MSEKPDPPSVPYVTAAECQSRMEPIMANVNKIPKVLKITEDVQEQVQRIETSLYGKEDAGVVRGGLVHMVRELYDRDKKRVGAARWFAERLLVPVIVAMIISLISLAVLKR